jgi:glycosyltransferase involved in cell wall biosynthesis
VRRYNPDVIVCEAPHNFVTIHRAARRQRRRGQGVVFWSKGSTPKRSESWKTRLRDRLFRRLYRQATVFLGYGRSSRQWAERLGFCPERIVIAQNTVDTRDLLEHPARWEERGRAFRQTHGLEGRSVVGTVSRLVHSKRVDLLLEAAAKISTRRGELTVLVGGGGPDADSLRQLADRWDALDVRFLGELPIDEDHTVFAASDVNVFCGAVGLAISQSMALGKPTVCADEPGADSELIIDGKTGLRFARGSADALTACIERVLGDPELARRLGNAGREHIIAEATVDNMIARLIEAIRLALATRPRASKENA